MKLLKLLLSKLGRSNQALAAGTGSSLGLAAAAGTCAAGVCGVAAFPIAGFLSSIGLGGMIPWLPALQIPLLIGATAMSLLVLRNVNRQGNPFRSSVAGTVLGAVLAFSGTQIFMKPTHSESSPPEIRVTECSGDPLFAPTPNADHLPEFR